MTPVLDRFQSTFLPWSRPGTRRVWDGFVLAWSLLFASWLLLQWGGERWALSIDLVLFGVMAWLTLTQQLRVARRVERSRDRLAWRLLAASSLVRFVSGSLWGVLAAAGAVRADPPWLLTLSITSLALMLAGLAAFPSAPRHAADRLRFRLDAATVLVGSLLVVWSFALGPYLRAVALSSTAGIGDQLITVGDAIAVVLASALWLRGDSVATRRAAAFLLVAFSLKLIPDLGFWKLGWASGYAAGEPIAAIWYAVWLLKWLSARSAEHEVVHPRPADPEGDSRYVSGPLPYAFLVVATIMLLFTLVTGTREDRSVFALGSALLAILLVARQALELRERDRLNDALRDEESRYRALLQHAYDVLMVIDREGLVRYASPATERLLGSGVRHTTEWATFDSIHPADRERMRNAFRDSREGPQTVQVRVRDQANEWRVFTGFLQDRRDDPLLGGFVLNGLDRTREERLSQGLRDVQRFEALGVLASGLAHDLNNILTVIGSHVDLLDDQSLRRPQARADLRAIRVASDRAQALTQGLLTLSRRKSTAWTIVEVGSLVRARVAASGLRFVQAPMQAGPAVRADGDALGQVIDVLLRESAETGRTGTAIEIHERELDATAAAAMTVDAGTYVVIAVGEPMTEPPERTEDAVRTADEGDWDLAPGDLSMLMALASTREIGGTLVSEVSGTVRRLAIYLPSVAS